MKRLLQIIFAFSLAFCHAADSKHKNFETRTAVVKMNVSPNDLINIRAKNTDLVVETWGKSEVEIVATLRFDGKMTDKMTAFLDDFQERVEDQIQHSGGELKINTNLDEPNKVQIGSKKMGVIIGYSEEEFRLDYKIKAPQQNAFEIDNSYRDVTLTGEFGKLKFTQYSGKLRAGNIQEADLNMKYGTSSFAKIGTANIQIYEQELDAESIDKVELDAKYSEVEVGRLSDLKTESYETDFVIRSINEIDGKFKYGKMEIEEELGTATLDFYEMDIHAKRAKNVKFTSSKYGKLKFGEVNRLVFTQSYEDELTIGKLGQFRSMDSKYGQHDIEQFSGSYELNGYEDDINIHDVANTSEKIEVEGKYIKASLGISHQPFTLHTQIKYGKVEYNESKVDVRKYIKEGDVLEVEINSRVKDGTTIPLSFEGYEIDVRIE